MKHRSLFVSALLASCATGASAVALYPVTYDMPNGDGVAATGTYNYWDRNHSGSGSTTTDGTLLSGGLGKLTDGFVSVSPWYEVSNAEGTGEYVGWRYSTTSDPLITFNFAGTPTIDSITIQLDNTWVGGVYAPAAILIDGTSMGFTAPAQGTVGSVSFTGLGLVGSSHTIQFMQANNEGNNGWTFVSEISFDATPPIPEPGTWALMAFGLAGIAGFVRRRN